jgi:catechol 2,3-dioxygenase-like lactoylglutathione lyase family enzyme
MSIGKLAHYSIRSSDLDRSEQFYCRVLGLRAGFRPAFPFPGRWLYREGDESDYGVVHLIGIDADHAEALGDYLGETSSNTKGTGALDHIAFAATGLSKMRARLIKLRVPFHERCVPDLGLHQVFLTDPTGVTLELNFPADET